MKMFSDKELNVATQINGCTPLQLRRCALSHVVCIRVKMLPINKLRVWCSDAPYVEHVARTSAPWRLHNLCSKQYKKKLARQAHR